MRMIAPRGRFDLRQTLRFGFGQRDAVPDKVPDSVEDSAPPTATLGAAVKTTHGAGAGPVMRMAFVLDGYREPVGALIEQLPTGQLSVEPVGAGDPDAVVRQVARVLSVDVDASGWDRLGEQDTLLGRVQQARPGLRPPLFFSAYEALVWAVLSARRPASQMVHVRAALSARHGAAVEVAGQTMHVLPTPAQLLRVDSFAGLSQQKVHRLHAVAEAAMAGWLETGALRALPPAEAAAALRSLDGIGPFYADLVVIRALGHTDVLPQNEPRLLAALGQLTGAGRSLTADELVELASNWAGWRTWAAVAVRAAAGQVSSTESVAASRV